MNNKNKLDILKATLEVLNKIEEDKVERTIEQQVDDLEALRIILETVNFGTLA